MVDERSNSAGWKSLGAWILAAAIALMAAEAPISARPAARSDNAKPPSSKTQSPEALSKKVKSIVKTQEAEGPIRDGEIVRDEAGSETMPKINGGRDPFKAFELPAPRTAADRRPHGPLPPGVPGLIISDLRLEGIVREEANHTMIAVVTNATNIAYFLRDHDHVYDGSVSRITPEAVYFTESYPDPSGSATRSREIVMRLGPISGEAR